MAENKTIALPDVGDFQDIEIIELLVAPGDVVEAEQSIIVLESDKATMEIPSPFAGTIESLSVKVGDRLNEGDKIATLISSGGAAPDADEHRAGAMPGKKLKPHPGAEAGMAVSSSSKTIHASPSIRRYARELGVNLERVIGSGPKGRLLKAVTAGWLTSHIGCQERPW